MNPIPTNATTQDPEEVEDTLSLCDLPLHYQGSDSPVSPNSPSHPQDLFDFSFNPRSASFNSSIVFCGKIVEEQKRDEIDDFSVDQSRYLFPLSSARLMNSEHKKFRDNSGKAGVVNSKPASLESAARFGSCRYGSSRKHNVLIGLARIPAKMELSDIKKRQSKRNPAPLFVMEGGGQPDLTVKGGGVGLRALMKPLRCRAHLARALAKASLGCIGYV
ncbi:hypothetical protein SLEP1_g5577 [Rubroshorea leprosula]|uniref:Uncharacterized protein n=1 Tax=Rubroshorea leprosula TaxID=152421 RepID=A0AAV5HYP3_9ROSI|nr:hypothetical protein SLEP1_g5577 [Rubroshorea leprosula]